MSEYIAVDIGDGMAYASRRVGDGLNPLVDREKAIIALHDKAEKLQTDKDKIIAELEAQVEKDDVDYYSQSKSWINDLIKKYK